MRNSKLIEKPIGSRNDNTENSVVMPGDIKKFKVGVSLSHLLNHIRVKPYRELEHEYSTLMDIPGGTYGFYYTYMYDYPRVKKVHTLPESITVLELLKIAAVGFESCYGVPYKDTNSCVVPPMRTDWEVQLANYTNKRGDSHIHVTTPFFDQIEVDVVAKTVGFWMGN